MIVSLCCCGLFFIAMKKLGKIHLKDQMLLSKEEMKKVTGLGLSSGTSGSSGAWCCASDGICVGPFTSCTTSFCESLYGSGAYCD